MDDPFYDSPIRETQSIQGLLLKYWNNILSAPSALLVTIFLGPVLLVIATRLLSEKPSRKISGDGKVSTVWSLPYWFPGLGHAIAVLRDPHTLMMGPRDASNGIFALNLGGTTHTVVSDPSLVKSAMTQKQSAVQFHPIAWNVAKKFFGISNKPKYDKVWTELTSQLRYLMKEPELSLLLNPTIRILETNIPQMISFTDSDIDLQPWEKASNASFISPDEVELDLMKLLRDLIGHASIPAMFGRGLLEKHPNILEDLFEMDEGMFFFLIGLPPLTPWPGVWKTHMARRRLWAAVDEMQKQLDLKADGKETDYSWGDLDDVSDFIMERHRLWKENDFTIKERGDLSILWGLTVNANYLVGWHTLYILSTPDLLASIRKELAPHVTITPPTIIGSFSSPPSLSISHEGLSKSCPLFKSSYLEALRLSSQPWSVRSVVSDIQLARSNNNNSKEQQEEEYLVPKGNNILIPHELHMLDPTYFPLPTQYVPDRFLVPSAEDPNSFTTDPGTTRPFGGGASMCKGRVYAERECLALVAGVLMMWDFEPVGSGEGKWVVPEMVRASGVSRPKGECRVRVKRRKFEWDG